MKEPNKILTDFILSNMEPALLKALEILSSLEYPIHDLESLKKQLEAKGVKSEKDSMILELVPATLMPMMTAQSGLEKFSSLFNKEIGPFGRTPSIITKDEWCRGRAMNRANNTGYRRGSILWLEAFRRFYRECILDPEEGQRSRLSPPEGIFDF